MLNYGSYRAAEKELIDRIIEEPQFLTKTTYERIGEGFILTNPFNNTNDHSNYVYAEAFFHWLISGEKQLSKELLDLNPWVSRFVSGVGLPKSFSSSYGWKIKKQIDIILTELKEHDESRRAYVNILYEQDHIILPVKTTMEYPCTIGFQFFLRHNTLYMIVNMRSNNVLSVMPYDVYNFTRLQQHIAGLLNVRVGTYIHQINNAHLYKGDVRRLKQNNNGNQHSS